IEVMVLRRRRKIQHRSVAAAHTNRAIVGTRRKVDLNFLLDGTGPGLNQLRRQGQSDLLGSPELIVAEVRLQVMLQSQDRGCTEQDKDGREQTGVPKAQLKSQRARVHPVNT